MDASFAIKSSSLKPMLSSDDNSIRDGDTKQSDTVDEIGTQIIVTPLETEPAVRELKERLLGLYGAACAPLATDTIINDLLELDPTDFSLQTVLEEWRFVRTFITSGFQLFDEAFDLLSASDSTKGEESKEVRLLELGATPEVGMLLLCASQFSRRLEVITRNLNRLCMNTVERLPADPVTVLKEIEAEAKRGARARETNAEREMEKCLDFTPNTRWTSMEIPLKSRVGFKKTAAVISEGKVEEQELKVAGARRKKQRNPTGYHKFNFKDLRLDESDFDSESRPSRASSTPGAPSTDGGSTRGSVSGGLGGIAGGILTSRSGSSGGEDDTAEDNALYKESQKFHLEDRNSSVVFSFEKERQIIEDEEADPDWEEQQRHQRRFSRIRNRVPTGHPSLSKGPSDELAGIVSDYEKQLSAIRLDTKTAENTELNKHVTPVPFEEESLGSNNVMKKNSAKGQKRNVTMADDV